VNLQTDAIVGFAVEHKDAVEQLKEMEQKNGGVAQRALQYSADD
jgi:hypothetical protein